MTHEEYYTLRQVAEMTGTPLPTVRHWVWVAKVLPVEHVGPTRRVRVRRSVLVRFFPPISSGTCMTQ
jgi:hypothetical protein